MMFSRYNTQEDEATRPLITKLSQKSTRQSKYQHFFTVVRDNSWAVKTITSILCGVCILSVVVATIFLPRVSSSALSLCLTDENIPFTVQGSVDWKRSIRPWNVRLTYIPAAVATPHTIQQIQVAVNCGIKSRVRVTAKGGGHSFGSYGLGGEDGYLVIELQQLNKVTLFENGTARIEPGARLGHVSSELYKQGGRAIPHGACPGSVFPQVYYVIRWSCGATQLTLIVLVSPDTLFTVAMAEPHELTV